MRSRFLGVAAAVALPVSLYAQVGRTQLDHGAPSYMWSSGTPGNHEASLGWWLFITACAVVGIVAILLAIALWHGRKDRSAPDTGERQGEGRGVTWIYVGIVVTVLVLIVSFTGTLVTMAHASGPPSAPPITLDVTGHRWWWEVRVEDSVPDHAFVTANEVHIPVGVPIRLRVQSADVIHSFWIPQLAGKIDVIPGQINESWFRADQPGVYRGQCVEYCGLQHAHMGFAVVAEPMPQYQAWAASQRDDAPPPAGGEAASGQMAFVRTCGACHAVRGTHALGRLGPDLTHLASRLTIGAGLADNTRSNLLAWVGDPQALKPGVQMPDMHLGASELAHVVAYLQTLH